MTNNLSIDTMLAYHILMIIYEATIIDMYGSLLLIAQNLLQSKARAWFLVSHEVAPAWLSSLMY